MKKLKGIIFAMAIFSIIFMPLSTLATSDNLESNNISLMWDNERYIISEIFVNRATM